ncbi:MAG: phospholipase D-like domain-containing protein [Thiohalospira sp.]
MGPDTDILTRGSVTEILQTAAGLLVLVATLAAARHALFFKRQPRSAQAWLLFILLLPPIGALFYYLLGVNRVRTRARKLKGVDPVEAVSRPSPVDLRYGQLECLGRALSGRPLAPGNRVTVLQDGEAAYPAMIAAIEAAEESIWLSTYIFDPDRVGEAFIAALARAVERGVRVRVLVDGVGELYALPHRVTPRLRAVGVPNARFLPPRFLPPVSWMNLRNHRKVLTVDDRVAFTGGMNLSVRHCTGDGQRHRATDVHFRLEGPVAAQLAEVVAEDWHFVTGEESPPPKVAEPVGEADCRVVVDGPNEDLDRLKLLLVGAVATAKRRVAIMTPYFLPPRELIAALQAAALRGLEVDLLLPARNNLPYVHWATRNMLWEVLQWDVRVHYQPPPFAHGKLFLVDGEYAVVGSANLDPRSLRLNFELVVETWDPETVTGLQRHFDTLLARSRPVTLAEVDGRPWYERLRDASAWVFSPYL